MTYTQEAIRAQGLIGYRLKRRGQHVGTVMWQGDTWEWATIKPGLGTVRQGYAPTPEKARERLERALSQ